jgi:hypothetical protein
MPKREGYAAMPEYRYFDSFQNVFNFPIAKDNKVYYNRMDTVGKVVRYGQKNQRALS